MALICAVNQAEGKVQRPIGYSEPQWYAAYTWANHEKRVADQFVERTVEHFLPTFESIRRWSHRLAKGRVRPGWRTWTPVFR